VTDRGTTAPGARLAGRVAVVFGALLHLVVGAFVLASPSLVPAPVTFGLAVLWGGLAALGWHWRHRWPPAVLLLPFVAALALWLAVRLTA
jgi:hypothetical protein